MTELRLGCFVTVVATGYMRNVYIYEVTDDDFVLNVLTSNCLLALCIILILRTVLFPYTVLYI